ncbi:MAG: hypothetical protein JO307_12340 [Bryobacterales bacterium]|nr:hypothetical protein [Bryobacterales bacterium]MBV9400410.1 hypothetical protein [Bryobacterales bacterium]
MTNATKLIAGCLLIAITTIEYGGTFLLSILSGKYAEFTEFQRSMFRAGHAHAGVLTVLALVALLFTDQATLSTPMGWAVRIGFAAAPVLVGAGFFGAAIGNGRTQPGGLVALLWIGVFVLGGSLIVLGIHLLQARG